MLLFLITAVRFSPQADFAQNGRQGAFMIDTKQYVIKQIEERNIRFLRLWFTDIFGNLKNVAITPSDIEIAFEEGIGFDGSSIDGLASLQDSDMLVHPDPSTFQVLPWRPSDDGVARMFCDLRTPDGAPAAGAPFPLTGACPLAIFGQQPIKKRRDEWSP